MDARLSIEEMQDQVLLYHSEELAEEEVKRVELWLEHDPELRDFYEQLSKQEKFLAPLVELQADVSVSHEVLQKFQNPRPSYAWLYATVPLAAALIIALFMVWENGSKPQELVKPKIPVENVPPSQTEDTNKSVVFGNYKAKIIDKKNYGGDRVRRVLKKRQQRKQKESS